MTHPHSTTAIILAGGRSSRFIPFNSRPTHKSMFHIMGKPIIAHTLDSLQQAGITKAVIVHNPTDKPIKQLIKNQTASIQLISVTQEKPLGQANAILAAKKHITQPTLVLNPQHINAHQLLESLTKKEVPDPAKNCIILSQSTDTPQKYGILKLNGNRVEAIVEKPDSLKNLSNQRIVGLYLINPDFVNKLNQTQTEEYQLENTLNYIAKQQKLYAYPINHPTFSLKYAWDLHPLAQHLLKTTKPYIHKSAKIHPSAIINGDVTIKKGASVHEYAIIDGPTYLGPQTVIGRYTEVGEGTILEKDSELQRRVEIKRSIVGKGAHIHSGVIGDSIIGEHAKIGANFITANRRLDRKTITYRLKEKVVNTNNSYAGAIIGDHSAIGIHSGTNPGTILASQTHLYPGTIATGYVST